MSVIAFLLALVTMLRAARHTARLDERCAYLDGRVHFLGMRIKQLADSQYTRKDKDK